MMTSRKDNLSGGKELTFCEVKDWTSWGRMFSATTASARLSLWSASRPRARAAVCWMLGTTSSTRGRSKDITPAPKDRTGEVDPGTTTGHHCFFLPAFWRSSTFCGLVARSATVWTKWSLDFWYCSKTVEIRTKRETVVVKQQVSLCNVDLRASPHLEPAASDSF